MTLGPVTTRVCIACEWVQGMIFKIKKIFKGEFLVDLNPTH